MEKMKLAGFYDSSVIIRYLGLREKDSFPPSTSVSLENLH